MRGVHEVLPDQYASALPLGIGLLRPLDSEDGSPFSSLRPELQCLRQGLPHPGDPLPLPGREDSCQSGDGCLTKEMCLVWAQNKICLICDEICPYNAIVFRPVEGYRRPVVIASKCNGCGFCEQRCPVQGESAIVVVPDGEIRLKEGSYVKEAKKLQLEFKADPGDDKFILEESGFKIEEGRKQKKIFLPKENPQPKKPKGFL